jgi:hypothetical protein
MEDLTGKPGHERQQTIKPHSLEVAGRPPIEDVEIHYGPATRPQERLPFSVHVRRKYPWWPGSERRGKLVDRLLIVLALTPCVIWAGFYYGWAAVLCGTVEALVILELLYRFWTGSLLGD